MFGFDWESYRYRDNNENVTNKVPLIDTQPKIQDTYLPSQQIKVNYFNNSIDFK
jgi:hypothetical protein